MRYARWMTAVLILAGMVWLVGCPPRATPQAETEGDQRVAGSEERTGEGAAADPTEVQVGLTDFAIALEPDSAPAGAVNFNVRNNGEVAHAFEVEGQGIERETSMLQPGETATLTIENMAPGTYEVYCPVDDHYERGMRETFTVTDAGTTGGSPPGS